jgi:hypothetical protein
LRALDVLSLDVDRKGVIEDVDIFGKKVRKKNRNEILLTLKTGAATELQQSCNSFNRADPETH